MSDGLARWRPGWSQLLLFLGLLTMLTTIFGVVRHFTPVPLGDQWDGTIGFYMRAQHDPFSAWFEQHNEYRLIFSRVLFYLDVRYFGGRNVSLLAANLVLAGLLATTIFRIAKRDGGLTRQQGMAAAGVILVFIFSWMQFENFTWGFQNQWFAVYLFALWAFESVELSSRAALSKMPARSWQWLLLVLVCVAGAACSMSSGLLVIVVVALQASYRRLGWSKFLLVVTTGAATWGLYFHHWKSTSPKGQGLDTALHQPVGIFEYFLLYFGAPINFVHVARPGVYAWGLLVCVGILVQSIRLIRGSETKAVSLLALCVFVLGAAILTAIGRLPFGLDSALTSRYTTASLACTLALAIHTWMNAKSVQTRRGVLVAGTVMLIALVLFQRITLKADDERYARDVGGLALRAHVYDSAVTRPIYPFEAALIPTATAAEAAGLTIFSPHQKDFYVAPARVSASARCDGYVDRVWQTKTAGVYGASGWIYNSDTHRVPKDLVVADLDGNTLGTGISGGKRDDVKAIHGDNSRFSGWTAFFLRSPDARFSVVGRLSNGTFCSIADTTIEHAP